jgi:hypothetical protein
MSNFAQLRKQQLLAKIAELSNELSEASRELYALECGEPEVVTPVLNVVKRAKKKFNGRAKVLEHIERVSGKYNNQSIQGNGRTNTN